MKNKNFLVDLLQLSTGVETGNKDLVLQSISNINQMELEEDQVKQLKDFLNKKESNDIILLIIESLNCIKNKESLKMYIKLNENAKINKNLMQEALTLKLTFDNESDKYAFYYLVTRRVIDFNDIQLTKAAIEKMQNI